MVAGIAPSAFTIASTSFAVLKYRENAADWYTESKYVSDVSEHWFKVLHLLVFKKLVQ